MVQVPTANAQQAAHLTITLTGQNLTAGFNSTVTVAVLNNWVGYSSIYNAIYDVDIAVSLPAPLTIYGDNHWHFDSILYGQTVTLTFGVFAPSPASGSSVYTVPNSYVGTVTATYKQLGDTAYTQESHNIAMSVLGWINLVLYGIQPVPQTVTPGGNTTISGNILNGGNLASYNANVSAVGDILAPDVPASVYVGEVDPNIPRPFSLLATFKQNIRPGNYTVTLVITAIDQSRPNQPFRGKQTTSIQVVNPQQGGAQRRPTTLGPLAIIYEILRYIYDFFFGSTAMHLMGILHSQ
jgi:hypothetical protein